MAAALGAPGLQLGHRAHASRWRGPIGEARLLALPPGQPHHNQRLHVLRRVLDLQADGRWALPQLAETLASQPHPALLRRLFLWLDGRRVDALLAQRFPGAQPDLVLDPAPALPGWLAAHLPHDQPVALAQHMSSRPVPVPALPADAMAALQLALRWHQRLLAQRLGHRRQPGKAANSGPLLQIQPATGPGDGLAAGSGGAPGDGGGSGMATAAGGRLPGATRLPAPPQASQPSSSDALPPGPAKPAPDHGTLDQRHASARPGQPAQGSHTTWHDEWDVRLQAYRRHWVAVQERRMLGNDLQFLPGLQARFPALMRQLRRRFAHLQAHAPQRERRLRDGDAVDLEAALDALVARRTGQRHGDDRLYQARPLHQRSLSVALLLDMSSSTGFPIPDRSAAAAAAAAAEALQDDVLWHASGSRLQVDSTPRRRVIDVARDAAALLCEALTSLGDRHAVFGFSGQGRLQVDFAVIKDFADPWSAQPAAALAAVRPQGATRTGAAVRHAVRRLQAEPARRKLLIVLSDGYPQDSDYGDGVGDGVGEHAMQYGLQDTAQALREAERAGVTCFNLSVDAAANDYLRRICPAHRYWVIDDVDALPARMLALVRLLAMPA